MKSLKCTTCYQILKDCLCFHLPQIESKVPFVVVQHWKERSRASNTGRLIHLTIQPSFCFFNQTLAQIEELNHFLSLYTPYLIFPSTYSVKAEYVAPKSADRPLCFVFLDGTWRQALRMRRQIESIASLPCIQIQPTEPSVYQLRKQNNQAHLSTVEAAIQLIKESQCADSTPLETLFHQFVQQGLKSRGKILKNSSSI